MSSQPNTPVIIDFNNFDMSKTKSKDLKNFIRENFRDPSILDKIKEKYKISISPIDQKNNQLHTKILSYSNESETSPDINESETSPDVNESESNPEVNESETSSGVNESESNPEVNESESSPGVNESESSPDVNEPETSPGINESESSPGVKEPEISPGINEPETSPGINEPETSTGVNEPETSPGVNEPETSPDVNESETNSNVNEPETSPGVNEPESSQGINDKSDHFVINDENDSDMDELIKANEIDVTINEIDETIYTNPTFNIGVFGCINSGKSTFINSLLGNKYAEMNVKRCTMCPQIYETKKGCQYSEAEVLKIREEIEKINKQNESLASFEIINKVPPIDILNNFNNIEFKIYDIPGLNDSRSNGIMDTYIENNFYKFDLIIFNIDITQGLVTESEIKILETIQSMIDNNNKRYNRNIKLFIVCNKFDDLNDDELLSLYEQVQEQLVKYKIDCPVIKYSSKNTHIYRYLTNTEVILDNDTLKNFGKKFMGMSWSIQSEGKSVDEKMVIIKNYIKQNSKGLLKLSGFDVLCTELQKIIKDNIHDLMYSKINYCTSIKKFKYKYNFIMKLNKTFSHEYNREKISEYLDQYLEYFEKRYTITDIQSMDDKISRRIDKIFNKLQELNSIILSNTDKPKIDKYFIIYYNILADYEISKLINNQILSGDILNIILQIQKTPSGMKKLKENINYLDKVPIEDFKPMIEQLFTFGFEHKILLKLYSIRIINYYNTSDYSNMIKNFIVKKYHETHDEYFNYLSCHINSNTVVNNTFNYDHDEANNIYEYLENLLEFYSKK